MAPFNPCGIKTKQSCKNEYIVIFVIVKKAKILINMILLWQIYELLKTG